MKVQMKNIRNAGHRTWLHSSQCIEYAFIQFVNIMVGYKEDRVCG